MTRLSTETSSARRLLLSTLSYQRKLLRRAKETGDPAVVAAIERRIEMTHGLLADLAARER